MRSSYQAGQTPPEIEVTLLVFGEEFILDYMECREVDSQDLFGLIAAHIESRSIHIPFTSCLEGVDPY